MERQAFVNRAITVFLVTFALIFVYSFAVAQLELPQLLRSALVISGSALLGRAAVLYFISWLEMRFLQL